MIVDDDPAMRALLRVVVEGAGFAVAGEAADGTTAVTAAAKLRPAAITMDLEMPGMNGAEATRAITSTDEPPAIIIVSGATSSSLVGAALNAGARWHIAKTDAAEQLPVVLGALLGSV